MEFYRNKYMAFLAAILISYIFIFRRWNIVSCTAAGLLFMGSAICCRIGRILFYNYSSYRINPPNHKAAKISDGKSKDALKVKERQHIYIIGSKSIGQYGGYESFVMNLLQMHESNESIKYYVACKANGSGFMDLTKLPGANRISDDEFTYHNAHCFMIKIPEKIGSAQAIYYDIQALKWCCNHIEKNHIPHPIVYILASRIGPFEKKYAERIHDAGGQIWQNPDGHEDQRRKWTAIVRRYWKFSERYAVKNADLIVCDSRCIEEYIKDEYSFYKPNTTFIAYGSHIQPSVLGDDDPKYVNWLTKHNLADRQYYISVGRFVPENNFDIMIREFMSSNTNKDFAIITTENSKYAQKLQQKLQYRKDKRIKFVGTVYDSELLDKIRANAYGYIHGHEVGGTNPSLLESLGSTRLNLLYDVDFNKEVAKAAALYWSKEESNLARLIDKADKMSEEEIAEFGRKAKKRIAEKYNWQMIADKYQAIIRNKG